MRKLRKGEALMLRTCDREGKSYGGFQWPQSGPVKCPDWKATKKCGNGLHGLLWGSGDGSLLDWSADSRWLVVIVDSTKAVDIDGQKIKVPEGEVCYCGNRFEAAQLIAKLAPAGTVIVGGTATAGDGGTATAGYRGTATAGDGGTATAGYRGTATAGDGGTATAGDGGTATAGDGGSICIRYWNGERHKMACFDVGENNIEANIAYRVNEKGEPQAVQS